VLESPCNKSFTFALWYHFISSSRNNCASLLFRHCLMFISSTCSGVCSAFLSNPSRVSRISFFSLYCPLVCLTHPLKYWRNIRILPCHLSIGVLPTCVLVHISLNISMKPSLKSHPNSNLNIGCVAMRDDSPEFSRRVCGLTLLWLGLGP
jgi:hypothetical protein